MATLVHPELEAQGGGQAGCLMSLVALPLAFLVFLSCYPTSLLPFLLTLLFLPKAADEGARVSWEAWSSFQARSVGLCHQDPHARLSASASCTPWSFAASVLMCILSPHAGGRSWHRCPQRRRFQPVSGRSLRIAHGWLRGRVAPVQPPLSLDPLVSSSDK